MRHTLPKVTITTAQRVHLRVALVDIYSQRCYTPDVSANLTKAIASVKCEGTRIDIAAKKIGTAILNVSSGGLKNRMRVVIVRRS